MSIRALRGEHSALCDGGPKGGHRPEECVKVRILRTHALPLRGTYGLHRTEHCAPLAAARMDI